MATIGNPNHSRLRLIHIDFIDDKVRVSGTFDYPFSDSLVKVTVGDDWDISAWPFVNWNLVTRRLVEKLTENLKYHNV